MPCFRKHQTGGVKDTIFENFKKFQKILHMRAMSLVWCQMSPSREPDYEKILKNRWKLIFGFTLNFSFKIAQNWNVGWLESFWGVNHTHWWRKRSYCGTRVVLLSKASLPYMRLLKPIWICTTMQWFSYDVTLWGWKHKRDHQIVSNFNHRFIRWHIFVNTKREVPKKPKYGDTIFENFKKIAYASNVTGLVPYVAIMDVNPGFFQGQNFFSIFTRNMSGFDRFKMLERPFVCFQIEQ